MTNSLKKDFLILFSATFLSKIIGFIRELVLASKFGVSEEFDTFLTVYVIPATIVSLFLYAVPNIIIPRLNLNETSDSKFYKSFSEKYFWSYLFLLLIIVSLYLVISHIYTLVNPINNSYLLYKLFWLFGLYIFFYSVYAMFKALYNSKNKFVLPAFSPLLIHGSVILCVFFFYELGVISFALGLVIGSILQVLVYFFDLNSKNVLKYFKFSIKPSKLQYSTYAVIIFIELLGQSYVIIDRFFIEILPEGHISAMHYAGILANLPVTIIGMSFGTLLFPKMAQFIQSKKFSLLKINLKKGVFASILIGFVVLLVFIFFGDLIISILFERGKFEKKAVSITNSYLYFSSIGLPFILTHVILAKLCFAFHKEKILLISTVVAILLKFLLSVVFIQESFFQGLSLATSIAFIVNVIIITISLYKKLYHKLL